MLTVRDLWKSFETPDGPVSVLSGVSLTVAAGRSLALLGESGSGKSTLLHLIAGLERPDRGEVSLDGRRVEALSDAEAAALRREAIGLVFQQFNLIPSLTVEQNIALQARLAGRFDADWAARLAEGLGIAPLTRRYPEELSGGQQQRVAIARALAPRPKVILADEPTGNLDEATGDQALAVTLDLVAESGAILIMATHSARLAARLEAQATLRAGRLA